MSRIDLTGFETGRLKVIKEAGKDKNGQTLWECRCSCGNICYKKTSRLTGHYVKSCGCLQKEAARKSIKKAAESRNFKGGSCLNAYDIPSKRNTQSGVKGVQWSEKGSKWVAKIRYAGKSYHLGLYLKLEDAAATRATAEKFIRENFDDPEKIKYFLKNERL